MPEYFVCERVGAFGILYEMRCCDHSPVDATYLSHPDHSHAFAKANDRRRGHMALPKIINATFINALVV